MSTQALESHYANPHHMGALDAADFMGMDGMPGEGPFMSMYLKVDGDRIAEAWFETYGCPIAVACGSWLTRWAAGCTAEEARVLEAGDLCNVFGGLPLGKEHCASLAVNSLRSALRQWEKTQPSAGKA